MIETHKKASAIAIGIKDKFIGHLSALVNDPDCQIDRVGYLDEKNLGQILAGKKIDIRPVKMMAISGKGDRNHPESMNVSLFDHSINVACGAVRLAAHDMVHDDIDEYSLESTLAQVVVVGFAHDIDKLYQIEWHEVTPTICEKFIAEWHLNEWLSRYNKELTPETLFGLINGVEARTAAVTPPKSVAPGLFSLVRRYIRAADMLESVYLKSLNNPNAVVKAWNQVHSQYLQNPNSFYEFEIFSFSDPHNTFLLDTFQDALMGVCCNLSGMPPLFSAIIGGTLTSFIPASLKDEILSESIKDLIDFLPLNTSIVVAPQGGIKLSGAAPTYGTIDEIIRWATIKQGNKFFPVKTLDFETKELSITNELAWKSIKQVANDAMCPAIEDFGKGALTYVVPKPGDNSPELSSIIAAAKIVFLTSVQEVSKNKEMKVSNRFDKLQSLLGVEVPEWVGELEPLTQRTYKALACAAALMQATDDVKNEYDQYVESLLSDKGIYSNYSDKSNVVIKSVADHFNRSFGGCEDESSQGEFRCIITGEAVDDTWKISAVDGLHNIKSSAISYREGRHEDKYREAANTHISPVSYAEYKLRQENQASGMVKSVPVKVLSMWSGGFFGSQYTIENGIEPPRGGEFSTYDALRMDASKITIRPLDSYASSLRFGRFEDLGDTFSERCDFFLRIIRTCQRTGRPLHVFQGLPHPVPDFFYADCLGRDLENLLGGAGLRIEELEQAKRNIEMVSFLARSAGDGGLSEVEIAKSFCYPASRLRSAIMAWWICEHTDGAERNATILANEIILKELKNMGDDLSLIPEIEMGRIARKFQKGPMRSDSNSLLEFVMRTAFEQAEALYASGRRGQETSDVYVATIAETLMREGQRKADSGGFFSASTNRSEGERLDMVATELASLFVRKIWFGICRGRPCKHTQKRQIIAAYAYAFKNQTALQQ